MRFYMHDGTVYDVDTSKETTSIFSDQYCFELPDGSSKRIVDTEINHIEDDIRLGDYYCSSNNQVAIKRGTYAEVDARIKEEQARKEECKDCFWFSELERDEALCHRNRTKSEDGTVVTVEEKVVYNVSCSLKKKGGSCIYDFAATPVLYRENQYCFFCEYPDGVPDNDGLFEFIRDNAGEDWEYWGSSWMEYKKKFGSYKLSLSSVASRYSCRDIFILKNSRNVFRFYVDFDKNVFILMSGNSYKPCKKFTETKWEDGKLVNCQIKGFPEFAFWFWQLVGEYRNSLKNNNI